MRHLLELLCYTSLPIADRLCTTTYCLLSYCIVVAFAHDDIQFDSSIELTSDIDVSNGTT